MNRRPWRSRTLQLVSPLATHFGGDRVAAPFLEPFPVWSPSFPHEPLPGASIAREALAGYGLARSDAGVLHALTVAVMHRSFLVEQEQAYPLVSGGMLTALLRLGGDFISREALLYGFRELGLEEAGKLSAFVAQVNGCLAAWSRKLEWIRDAVALSKGIKRATLPDRVVLNIPKQLVGALCLLGEDRVARNLILPLLSDATDQYDGYRHDPWSELQNQLKVLPAVDIERTGPDHDPCFTALLSDGHGRTATGSAGSKKEAKKVASIDYIEKHLGGIANLGDQRRRDGEPRPIGPRFAPEHAECVWRLQRLFDFADRDRGLLSQALIHPSWSYENKRSMQQCCQRDYTTLARIGDAIMQFECVRGQALRVCAGHMREFRFLSVTSKTVAAAFALTGLASGVLLGRGESQGRLRESVAAEILQATIAAVYFGAGAPDTLREVWPRTWDAVWQSLFPMAQREVDPSTAFVEHCTVIGVSATYEYTRTGPDHDSRFTCRVVLAANGSGEETAFPGPVSSSKTAAKHAASALALEACRALAQPQPVEALAGLSGPQIRIGQFLLRAQYHHVADFTGRILKLKKFKVLGAHFEGDLDQLVPWAVQIDALLAECGLHDDQPGFISLYRAQHTGLSRGHEGYHDAVTALLRKLIELDFPEHIDDWLVAELSNLCEIGRALGTDRPDEPLSDLLEEHRFLSNGRITLQGSIPSVVLLGNQASTISFLLKRLSRNGKLTVQVPGSGQTDLRLIAEQPVNDRLRASLDLWSALLPSVRFTIDADKVDIRLLIQGVETTGPIMRSLQTVFGRDTDPFYQAVADLLHDAKNQLTAARAAATGEADSVSDGLERQLAAQRHLDIARSQVARLQTVVPGMHAERRNRTDVGAFLRSYCRDLMSSLPSSIGLSIPSKQQRAIADIDRAGLTAVLDNLVKNAVEAMRSGGRLAIDWTSDDEVVMIEVIDDGPGIPESIVTAMETDRQLRSRKHHGNGIGLLSTKSMLQKVGGEIAFSSGATGCTCLIQIPIFDEAEE